MAEQTAGKQELLQLPQSKLLRTLNQSPHITWFYIPDIVINSLSDIRKIAFFPHASVYTAIKWGENNFSACLTYDQDFSKHFTFSKQSLSTKKAFTFSKGKPMFQKVRDSNDLRWISCPLKTQPLVKVNGFSLRASLHLITVSEEYFSFTLCSFAGNQYVVRWHFLVDIFI